jgi:hypothetical protein
LLLRIGDVTQKGLKVLRILPLLKDLDYPLA